MKISFNPRGSRIHTLSITAEKPEDCARIVKADPGLHEGLYRAHVKDESTIIFERIDYPTRQP